MHRTKLCFIFPFPGISKMYTDIIRGESMIICGFTSIFFSVFQRGILQMSSFKGKSIFFSISFLSFFFFFFKFLATLHGMWDLSSPTGN